MLSNIMISHFKIKLSFQSVSSAPNEDARQPKRLGFVCAASQLALARFKVLNHEVIIIHLSKKLRGLSVCALWQ